MLAHCFGQPPFRADRVWLVPANGGKPGPLTPALRAHGLFLGYVNAWHLPDGLYLQADNAHDALSIVREAPDGRRRAVHIPGRAGVSDLILAQRGPRLLVQSGVGVSASSALFWYNPGTQAITFLYRAPAGHYAVSGAIPFG